VFPARAASLADQLKGRIVLQVERNGESWYVHPKSKTRFYLSRPQDAFDIMRYRGLGVSNANLKKIPRAGTGNTGDAALQRQLSGYVLLQVEKNGEAWYVYPKDLKRYYLGRPQDAFGLMRQLGLGISDSNLNQITKDSASLSDAFVNWTFDGANWKPNGVPPSCANPFIIHLPVDGSRPTSVLYPGQVRGGQYKPHGGFRLDTTAYDAVTITAPFDAYVVDGSRYYENGVIQYYFDFIHTCGIRYRLDHLHTLSATMQALADQLPLPTTSSQSTVLTPKLIKAGTVLATAVGFPNNTSFDLGLYDLRQRNAAAQSAAYRAAHADMVSNAYYAVCWFDWLSASDEAAVRALPPADGISGATSDYCAS
jgi:hypothetical protein